MFHSESSPLVCRYSVLSDGKSEVAKIQRAMNEELLWEKAAG